MAAGPTANLYQSVRTAPSLHDPVLAAWQAGGDPNYGFGDSAPPPSRYTLSQAPSSLPALARQGAPQARVSAPNGGPPPGFAPAPAGGATQSGPPPGFASSQSALPAIAAAGPLAPSQPGLASSAQDLGRNATALALQRIMGVPGGPSTPGGFDPMAEMGNSGRLMAAAAGLEGQRLNLAAGDKQRELQRYMPTAQDSAGARATKLAYLQKLMTDQTAQDSALTANGQIPSVEDLASDYQQRVATGAQPRLVTTGTDAAGRPVQVIVNPRTGAMTRVPAPKTAAPIQHGMAWEAEQLHAALAKANAAGDKALAATLQKTIDNFHTGGLWGASGSTVSSPANSASDTNEAPGATEAVEDVAKAPAKALQPGARVKQGGRIYEFDGNAYNLVK